MKNDNKLVFEWSSVATFYFRREASLLGRPKGGRGCLIEVAAKYWFNSQYYTENNIGTLITDSLIGCAIKGQAA